MTSSTESISEALALTNASALTVEEPDGLHRLLGAYDTLLDRFMPPSILVDERWTVIDSFAGAGRFLTLRSRRPTQCVMELLCEPLRVALNDAMDRLCGGEHPVTISPVMIGDADSGEVAHRLVVSTVPSSQQPGLFYSLVIEPLHDSINLPRPYRLAATLPNTAGELVRESTQYDDNSVRERSGNDDGESFNPSSGDLLESTDLAVVLLDQDLQICRFTGPAARMFNLVAHDIGREIRTFAGVLEVPDLVDRIRQVINTGDADEVEVHLHRLGKYYVIRITPYRIGQSIEGASLTVLDLSVWETRKRESQLLSNIDDITARKELETELRLAISQRDEFLAMLSHELRNPLGAILNTCALLHRGRGVPKSIQQPISIVTRQARQMADLLDDLLDVSRITSGKIKLEKSPVLLADIVDEAVESQQCMATSRHQRLLVTYPDEPLRVFGDRSRLVQVIVNLLNNAIKYSGDGAVIAVTLEKQGRSGLIRVKDPGVGIEPELIESLFEMFAQKDSTLDRSSGGMGLGLHLVRRLVEFHSGRVFGRSDGIGKGTEFVVELPMSTRTTTRRRTSEPAKPTSSTQAPVQRIVVVEDIADARNMLVALLEADDYQVRAAADGEAGLELILQELPDLAIVDIGLPRMDGYEVARRVRAAESGRALKLVALSGYGQDSDHDRAIEAGFDLLLVKPLNHARLEKILRGV